MIFHKGTLQQGITKVCTRSEYKLYHSILYTRGGQSQWSYKALGDHSRPQTLSFRISYRVEYEMKLKELCDSRNSIRKNLRAKNQKKLAFERLRLKIES